jgi:hypothetical protein
MVCHGDGAQSGGLTPDLRWSNISADKNQWKSIVIDGQYAPSGMAGFKGGLTDADAEAIRAYVVNRANEDASTAKAALPAAPAPAAPAVPKGCSAVSVKSTARAGGADFELNLDPAPTGSPTYNWSVSSGAITSGQGTPKITVEAPKGPVTTTIEVGGMPPSCPAVSSATVDAR